METTRREFTALGGTLAVAAAAGPALAAKGPAAAAPFPADAWHQRIKRIMQVNFNERDPQGFDVEEWADYLASVKAQATFLSVTNIVAFYPTKLAGLPTSPFLGGRDLFGECARALRARDIRILGRLSIDIALVAVADDHPEWFRRNRDGSLVIRGLVGGPGDPAASTTHAATCQFSSYYSEFVPALIREVLGRYDIDGIYSNGWPGVDAPPCYCAACRAIGDPESAAYKDAYQKRAVSLWNLYDGIVTGHGPGLIFSGNLGGGFRGGDLDLTELTARAPWFLADNQGRGGVGAPAWDASQQTRIAKAVVGARPVPNSTAAYEVAGDNRWRNVTGNPEEVRSRLFQTAAAGGVLYYHWLGFQQGFREDRRWQAVGRDVLGWQAANDRHFHNVRSIARVALVVSQRSNRLYRPPAGTGALDSIEGMYQLLNEARVPFDVILDKDLEALDPRRHSTLILPNVALMSDRQALGVGRFVGTGGSLFATFETGLYDEAGRPRADFALGRLFDMKRTGPRESFGRAASATEAPFPGSSATQRIERDHALTRSFRDTSWIQGSSGRVPIAAEGPPILTHVAQYPWYPTETVYSRQPRTDLPTVVARERGRSRLVYFAEDIEAGYWRTGARDLGDLAVNAIRWLAERDRPLRVSGDGLIEAYGWQTEPGYAVHLVDFTNPGFRATAMRPMGSAGEQKVELDLPDARPIARVRALRGGQPLPFRQRDRTVSFTVPPFREYEMAALET